MTLTPKPITAWAIKAPDGRLFVDTVSSDARSAKRFFLNEITCFYSVWNMAEAHGYRCVKVHITPVQEAREE